MSDGYSKLDQVEKSINTGDAKVADGVLKTIVDPVDQSILKDMIKSKCTANDGLPSCTIDEGGIHFGGEHKMTMTDQGGKLGMRDDQPSKIDQVKDLLTDVKDTVVKLVKDIDPTTLLGNGSAEDAANKLKNRDNEIKKHID